MMKYQFNPSLFSLLLILVFSGQNLFAQSQGQLTTNFTLTGTIVQSHSPASLAIITTKQGEQIFSQGDEIEKDIILEKIETEEIWLSYKDEKYLLEINSSQASAPVSYPAEGHAATNQQPASGKKLTQHQIDHPEFYNEKGILMEGAVGLRGDATAENAGVKDKLRGGAEGGAVTSATFTGKKLTQHQIEHPEFYNEKGTLMEGAPGLSGDATAENESVNANQNGGSEGSSEGGSESGAVTSATLTGQNLTQHQIEHPEFYNEKGVLMEGAPGLNPQDSELQPLSDDLNN